MYPQQVSHPLYVSLLWYVGHLHSLLRLVPHVAHVEDRRQDLQHLPDVLIRHLQHLHGGPDLGKLLGIVPALAGGDSSSCQILVVRGLLEVELLLVVLGEAGQQTVEDVIVPLRLEKWPVIYFDESKLELFLTLFFG